MAEPRAPKPSAGASVSDIAKAFEQLMPVDRSLIECLLCNSRVPDIGVHLVKVHPRVELRDYVAQFPGSRLLGAKTDGAGAGGDAPRETPVTVSAAEAKRHPGGRYAALVEKGLMDAVDRRAYHEDVKTLVERGYDPSYQMASAAYLMMLARGLRRELEKTRRQTDRVFPGDTLKLLEEIEGKVRGILGDLEKARIARDKEQKTQDEPRKVVDDELAAAESWVRASIGEFQLRCSGCGMILTAPDIPGWAWTPVQTSHGTEWSVWNPEGFQLVRARVMPLAQLCLILRTSPEGMRVTAERRGEQWPEWIDLEAEERQLRTWLNALDAGQAVSGAVIQ